MRIMERTRYDDDERYYEPRRRTAKERSTRGFRRFKRLSCSTKRRFPDEERAKSFRNGLKVSGRLKNDLRVYQCPICNGYHLTGQTGST